MTDQELRDLAASNISGLKELRESQNQTDKQIQELRKAQDITSEQIQELRKAQRQTDEQMRQTDEQMKRTDEQMKKTDERLDRVGKQLGSIGNNQGDVAEEYFQNSLKKRLKIGKLKFDYMISNYRIVGKNIKDEYDILLVAEKRVAMIEVKYKAHENDVKKLAKKIENLKKLPQYKGYKIYAGVAGFYISDETIKFALKNGYFVLQRKGKVIENFTKELKVA